MYTIYTFNFSFFFDFQPLTFSTSKIALHSGCQGHGEKTPSGLGWGKRGKHSLADSSQCFKQSILVYSWNLVSVIDCKCRMHMCIYIIIHSTYIHVCIYGVSCIKNAYNASTLYVQMQTRPNANPLKDVKQSQKRPWKYTTTQKGKGFQVFQTINFHVQTCC